MTTIEGAWKAERANATHNRKNFQKQLRDDIKRWSLEKDDQEFLNLIALRKISDRALLSNVHVRKALQVSLIEALLEEYGRAPKRKRYWVTLAWDLGVTMERRPHIDLVSLRNVAMHHLRRCGLDGVGVVEIDVWKNFTGEEGRRIVAQVHFVGWPPQPKTFNRLAIQRQLRGRRGLRNSLGAHSAVIGHVTPEPIDMAHLGMYMSKAPVAAKNPVPRRDRHKLWSASLPKGSAARLTEIFSNMEANDVLFSIGEGSRITRVVQKAIRQAIKPRANSKPAPSRKSRETSLEQNPSDQWQREFSATDDHNPCIPKETRGVS